VCLWSISTIGGVYHLPESADFEWRDMRRAAVRGNYVEISNDQSVTRLFPARLQEYDVPNLEAHHECSEA
jgi:hypothetical protein